MASNPKQRWTAIVIALALTIIAVVWVNHQESQNDDIVVVTTHGKTDRHTQPDALISGASEIPVTQSAGQLPDLSERAQTLGANDELDVDLFKSHAWYVPPPPKPIVEEAVVEQKPTAPPLPFTYFGRLDNGPQGNLIFLNARNKLRTVKVGQIIDGAWRLDKEDATSLYFTYVPLSMVVTLSKSAKMMPAAIAPIPSDGQDQPRDF